MSVEQAFDALSTALGVVDGVRVYTDPGAVFDPPAAYVGPPILTYGGAPGPDPVTGQFLVILAVAADDRALPRLWSLLPVVVDALEADPDVVVTRASPGTWRNGAIDLTCYEIQLEMSINDRA